MKRLAKILIIIVVVLTVVVFAGVWYLNRWLKSPETRAYVEQELSKALKMPLKFETLTLSLFGGVKAEGVSVQDGGTQFFESPNFSADYRLLPLFSGQFVFKEIVVEAPRFVVVQKEDGSWKVPQLEDAKKEAKKEPKEEKPKPKVEGTPKPKKKSDLLVQKVLITNGQVDFYDKEHRPVLSASGVRVALQDVRADHLMGRVSAAALKWHGVLALTEFSAGVSNSPDKGVIIPDFIAKTGGGTITGGYSRKPEKPAKYSAKIKIANVELASAMAAGDFPDPNLSGMLSASIEVRGTGDDTKQLSGKATIAFKDGTCRQIEMINDLGAMLNVPEFANLAIPMASADIVIWNGRLNVKPLTINAPPIGLSATGTAKLDGKIDLAATLLADAKFVDRNPNIASQFGPKDAAGMRSLPFQVTGSLTKPKHNLQEKITGTKDKRMQRAIMIDAAANAILEDLQPGKPMPESEPKKAPKP